MMSSQKLFLVLAFACAVQPDKILIDETVAGHDKVLPARAPRPVRLFHLHEQ
jgi:hypothetical protein